MRVGFTGAGGTGKSTTLEIVSLKLDLPVLGSTSRKVFERYNISEIQQERMTPDEKWKLQKDIFYYRLEAEEPFKDTGFLSDRTIIDNYAYALLRCYASMSDKELLELEDLVRNNTKLYDIIFFFTMDAFDPEDDGLRQNNKIYRRLMENIMLGALNSKVCLCPRVISVPEGSPKVRSEFILDSIKKLDKDVFK